ncbi:MAG: phage head closure protein [Pirellulales bacterium]|nr:phage head closure protein [Pirellulales bacterium]
MTATVSAGNLTKRVAIERPVEAHVDGEVRLSWQTVATPWAAIEPLSEREYLGLGAVHQEATHRVVLRWRAGLDGSMRILYRGRVLELVGPPRNVDEANVRLELFVKETD